MTFMEYLSDETLSYGGLHVYESKIFEFKHWLVPKRQSKVRLVNVLHLQVVKRGYHSLSVCPIFDVACSANHAMLKLIITSTPFPADLRILQDNIGWRNNRGNICLQSTTLATWQRDIVYALVRTSNTLLRRNRTSKYIDIVITYKCDTFLPPIAINYRFKRDRKADLYLPGSRTQGFKPSEPVETTFVSKA